MTVREEVIEHIVEAMRTAEDQGLDALKAVKIAFPGTPDSVLGEASWMLEERRAEAWWSAVEKTIDGEIIRTALIKNGGSK